MVQLIKERKGVLYVETLLLTIGFIGIIFLVLTPWVKMGTLVAIGGLTGYFYILGVDSWIPIILFGLGLLLMGLELFIPDFGLLGFLAVLSIAIGLYYTTGDVGATIRDLTIALVTSVALIFILIRNGYSLSNLDQFVLRAQSSNMQNKAEKVEDKSLLQVGMVGTATTPLRPSGKVSFPEHAQSYDVLSSEGHVSTGKKVVIQEIRGTKIVVRPEKNYE